MTESDKLAILKDMLDMSDSSSVLPYYLRIAGDKILQRRYPYEQNKPSNVPEEYEYLQIEIAAYLFNKRGAEGQTAHKEGDISRSYESADVPPSMLKAVVPKVGVI